MINHALILAGDTDENLGDLAIVTATCDLLRSINPDIKISLVTSRPDRDRTRLDIKTISRGISGLSALFRTARDADVVICGGGGLFQDDDSLAKMPYWAVRLAFVRAASGSIVGLSIGAGPLDYRISRIFARFALRQLNPVSVRDPLAQSALAPLTSKNVEIVPDPAFLLTAAHEDLARKELRQSGVPVGDVPLVGVAVRRWFHKRSSLIPYKFAAKLGLQKSRGRQQMSAFVELAAAALDEVAERTNAHMVFMPTYNVEHEADIEVCRAISSKMQTGESTILQLEDPGLYKSVTGLLSVMLCGRMHAAILAAGQGTPIVGLAYNPKFFGMFSLVGQEDQCVSIDDFVNNASRRELAEMLVNAIREPEKYRPRTSEVESRAREFIEQIVTPPPAAR